MNHNPRIHDLFQTYLTRQELIVILQMITSIEHHMVDDYVYFQSEVWSDEMKKYDEPATQAEKKRIVEKLNRVIRGVPINGEFDD